MKHVAKYRLGDSVRVSVSRVDTAARVITRAAEEVVVDHIHDFYPPTTRKCCFVYGGKTSDGIDVGPFLETDVVAQVVLLS